MFQSKSWPALVLLVCFAICINPIFSQSSNLNINITVPSISSTPKVVQMVINGQVQPQFIYTTSQLFNCSLPPLFSYTQNKNNYDDNVGYSVTVVNPPQPITSPSISTINNNFTPNFTITNQTDGYTLNIVNNCNIPINSFDYFDRIQLTVGSGSNSVMVSYYVICNRQYLDSPFQWGLLIEIVGCTILIFIVSIYSKAWSFGGMGIDINIWMIVGFNILVVGGGLVGYFSYAAMEVVLNITCFVLGTIGVAICCNQLLFLIKNSILTINILSFQSFQFRIMELISVFVGIGFSFGWFFSGNNFIVNDVICCCMIIGFIKILKFTSLQTAGICFLITMALEMTSIITIHFKYDYAYNLLFLNKYNFPIQLQMPTINPVYNQKCAWLPFTAIMYPGMLVSYFRRFDSSRNTNVYLIVSTIAFFVGAIAWIFLSIGIIFAFPLGLISQPCMFGLVCIFAYRRRQIKVLWEGKFYDEQFADQQDLKHTIELISKQNGAVLDEKLIEQLKNHERDSRFNSLMSSDVIRSKFLNAVTKV